MKVTVKAFTQYQSCRLNTEADCYVALGIVITYPNGNKSTMTFRMPENQYNMLNRNEEYPIFPEYLISVLIDRINQE